MKRQFFAIFESGNSNIHSNPDSNIMFFAIFESGKSFLHFDHVTRLLQGPCDRLHVHVYLSSAGLIMNTSSSEPSEHHLVVFHVKDFVVQMLAITAIPFTGLIDADCRFTVYSRSSTNGPVPFYISNFVLEVKLPPLQP